MKRGYAVLGWLVACALVFATPAVVVAAPKLLVDDGSFSPDSFVRQIAVDREERWLLVSDFSTGVAFYDLAKGTLVNRFVGHSLAGDVSYQRDLDKLVTTGDRTIKIWNVGKQELERTIKQGFHSQFMNFVHLDPRGRFVYAQGVKYQLPAGKPVGRYDVGGEFEPAHLYFRGDRYVRVNEKGRGTVFSLDNDRQLASFNVQLSHPPTSIHFDQTRGEIYFGDTDGFVVYELETGRQGRVSFSRPNVYKNLGNLTDTCVTSDGETLVAASIQDRQLVFLEKKDRAKPTFIDNAKEVWRTTMASFDVECLHGRPQVVVAVAGDPEATGDTIALLDVPGRKVAWRLEPRLLPLKDLGVDRAGKRVAVRVGSDAHQVPVWNSGVGPDVDRVFTPWLSVGLDGDFRPQPLSEDEFARDFVVRSGQPDLGFEKNPTVRTVTSPSGHYEAIPVGQSKYKVVEHDGSAQRDLFLTTDPGVTYCLAFSPDETVMAFGGSGRLVKVNAVPGGRLIRTIPAPSYVTALAFTPDSTRLAMGTLKNEIWIVELSSGKVMRKISGFDGGANNLAVTADGRTLVSTSGDGGLRFWELSTGKLKVATYFDRALGFAAVTPRGYFDKSAHFDHLLWNVDGVPNSLDQYYEAFYRPQVVRAAMVGAEDKGLPTTESVGQPPHLRLQNVPAITDEREVTLAVGITDRGGGIGSLRVYANGTAVRSQEARGVFVASGAAEQIRNIQVPLSAGENRISVVAFNADDTVQSKPVELRMTARYAQRTAPRLFGVVVGIQDFANRDFQLKFARDDAALVAKTLTEAAKSLYDQVQISVLTVPVETTRDNLERVLREMERIDSNDLFVFYVASHGVVDDGHFYLLTSNVDSISSSHLMKQALRQEELAGLIMRIPAQKKLIVIDTCSAAALGDAMQLAALSRGLTEATAMKVLSRAVGTTVLAASSATQQALEGFQGHGLFTFALVEGLRGRADLNSDSFVKTTELADYLDDEVPELAERVFGRKQFPTVSPQGQAFPVGRTTSSRR